MPKKNKSLERQAQWQEIQQLKEELNELTCRNHPCFSTLPGVDAGQRTQGHCRCLFDVPYEGQHVHRMRLTIYQALVGKLEALAKDKK